MSDFCEYMPHLQQKAGRTCLNAILVCELGVAVSVDLHDLEISIHFL